MNRRGVLCKINKHLNGCKRCPARRWLELEYGSRGMYARIDGYCNRNCQVGAELQELGKKLGRGRTS